MVKINPSFPQTVSERVISQYYCGNLNMSREENASLVETICLEALESMMKLGELDVPATKACALSLSSEFDPPSLLFEQ